MSRREVITEAIAGQTELGSGGGHFGAHGAAHAPDPTRDRALGNVGRDGPARRADPESTAFRPRSKTG